MPFLPGVVKSVLENEVSYTRFEDFCVELYSLVEGIEIVPTSKTRDYGRDGRSALLKMVPIKPILCATLRDDIDTKVESDIARLSETTATNCIVYCSSKELTEAKCDSIERRCKELFPGLQNFLILGQIQLVRLIERHESIFSKYYSAEINNIEQALLIRPRTTPDIKEIGLLLALCTQTGENAQDLRLQISRHLILYTLHTRGALTLEQLASYITGQLHLPRPLSTIYLSELIEQLRSENYVTIDNNFINIGETGKDFVSNLPEQASSRLLEGRSAVREAITKLSGHVLADMQFGRLWDTFQDGLTQLFYSHGLSIVRMVRTILIESTQASPKIDFYPHIDKLATRSVSMFSNAEQADEVRQALIDMFSEKDSPAFQWLTQICCIYVMMCSLGLEELSSQQILGVLSTYHIVPDSDIVISLLCEGEQNHKDVERILKGWKAIGGKIMTSIPVLDEVAYHAWISDYDYSHYGNILNELSDYDANHIIENAFVRTFRKVSGGNTAPKYWLQYINQFRGHSKYDYSRILQDLREEFGAEILPKESDEHNELAVKVTNYLLKRISKLTSVSIEHIDYRIKNKLQRDGILIANVVSERHFRSSQGDYTTSCILSSAALLKEVDSIFRKQLGAPEIILSTAAVSFLLTLCPQISMSYNTLRSVLFDTALAIRLTPAQVYAFRVIAASGQWDVPWARRSSLHRNLQGVLYQEARSKGEPVSSLRDRLTSNEDPDYSVKIIADTLDRMAITPKTKEELIKVKAENQKLREELNSIISSEKSPRQTKSVPKTFKKKRR